MTTMLCLVTAFVLLTTADALTCEACCGDEQVSDCSKSGYSDVCYRSKSDSGCVPSEYINMVATTGPGCNDHLCWCLEDNCNSASWYTEFKQSYVPPPQCYTGIAGSNEGPKCEKTKLYMDLEYEKPSCWNRQMKNQCVENNKWMGMGDGCNDHKNKEACEGDSRSRTSDESNDGTSSYCLWLPDMNSIEAEDKCLQDDACDFDKSSESCSHSKSANENETIWKEQRGQECEWRLKYGCVENNEGRGGADRCTQHKDNETCVAYVGDANNHCSEGTCSGNTEESQPCAERTSEGWCTGPENTPTGCTWTKQCCQWIKKPDDLLDTCVNKFNGSVHGMCKFDDGSGPPNSEIVTMGYEHGLLAKKDLFMDKCAMIASFRTGKGAAVALGSDKTDLLKENCKNSNTWKSVGEHIGHTSTTIDEYCANFIPESSAMSALNQHKPSYIIQKAKQGQFAALFPGLKHLLYIVTAKPEYGECLFTAEQGQWGVGVCTCDGPSCNSKKALSFIVDLDKGPMRLLQFIDGSLSTLKNDINGVVSVMDAAGKLNPSSVGQVTEAHVDAIMQINGVSALTNKAELWGIVQDYQALLTAENNYKQSLMDHYAFKPVKIDASKVQQANIAAACELYSEDGIPNTVCLGSLSASKIKAVSNCTSVTVADLTTAKTAAQKLEMGIGLDKITTTTPTTAPQNTTAATAPPAAAPLKIRGSFALQVPDADAFMNDDQAKKAVKDSFAQAIGASPDHVELVFTTSTRRLNEVWRVRKLSGSLLVVSYIVTVPAILGANIQNDVWEKVQGVSPAVLESTIRTKITEVKGSNAADFTPSVASISDATRDEGTTSNAVVTMLGSAALVIAVLCLN